ncbi:MAG TPA: ABC transporter permease [Acidimicrobiia bacterium]|nr:ABC transporter permease [Acidimicrobiia bacterium]
MKIFLQFTVSGVAAGSLYAIVALGLVLLYRGTRVVNFAHAGFGAIGAYTFWNLYPDHVPMLVALVAALAAGAAAGIATERLVARPLAAAPILTLAVATLAVDEIIRFSLTKLASPVPRTVPPLITKPTVIIGGIVLPAHRLLILLVSFGVSLLLAFFLRRSLFGVAVRAAAEDLTSVRLRGVSGTKVTMFTWGVSAALSALAGLLVAPLLGLSPYFMNLVLIRAFAAALLGGFTSLGGSLVGGLVVGIMESHIQRYTTVPGAVEAGVFVVVVAVLLLRPHGLFGARETEAHAPFQSGRRGLRLHIPLPAVSPKAQRILAGTAAVAAAAVSFRLNSYDAFVGTVALTYAAVGVSMYILSGLSGQLSIGHSALMGIGGFGAGLLTTHAGLPYALALPIAGVAAAAGAVAIGLPSFRIRGLYLAVVTLTFAIAAERYVFRLDAVAGYAKGLDLPRMESRTVLLWALLVLVVSVVVAMRVTASKAGRAMLALHHDETVAASWGIAPNSYKLLAFGLSGFLAGCAGVTYATLIQHVTSDAFGADLSIILIAMAIVGGLGSIPGVIAGSFLFALLPEFLKNAKVWIPFIQYSILLGVILLLPQGMSQLWRREPAVAGE